MTPSRRWERWASADGVTGRSTGDRTGAERDKFVFPVEVAGPSSRGPGETVSTACPRRAGHSAGIASQCTNDVGGDVLRAVDRSHGGRNFPSTPDNCPHAYLAGLPRVGYVPNKTHLSVHPSPEPPSAEGDQDQCEDSENRRFDGLERPDAVSRLVDSDEVVPMSIQPLHLLQRLLNRGGA